MQIGERRFVTKVTFQHGQHLPFAFRCNLGPEIDIDKLANMHGVGLEAFPLMRQRGTLEGLSRMNTVMSKREALI